ncbi:MAG: hypothetical protein JAY84_05620 [Candidatus Thiodiazotropha taylori]|nr:hypothetical protein [Candidatus Thiodiazotropha taylori]
MHIVPKQQKLDPEQQRLLDLFEQIAPSERDSLMAFAEFLSQRRAQEAVSVERNSPLEPKPQERPGDESVVKAIKRLSESYFMLERDRLLDETSSLMTSHIMQGRAAAEVIDDLEALFKKHYQDYLSNS